MFRKALILAAVVLVFSACQVQADVIHSTWVGGSQGNWDNASNWDPPIVPDNTPTDTFVVTIDPDVGEVFVHLRQNHSINQLDCRGEVKLDGWKLLNRCPRLISVSGLTNYGDMGIEGIKLVSDTTNYGNLEISSDPSSIMEIRGNIGNYGYLELAETKVIGDVTNYHGAKLEFEDPGAEINGNLYNFSGGRIEVEALAEIKEGDIDNAGLILIYPQGQIWFENEFRNSRRIRLIGGSLLYWDEESGQGVLNNNSSGNITGFGVVGANQSIQNKGTICASTGPLLLRSNDSVTNTGKLKNHVGATLHIQPSTAGVNNQGRIEVNADGSVVFDCNLNNEPNGIIKLHGGTLGAGKVVQKAGAKFAGFGGITGDVFIDLNGVIRLSGPTNIVGKVTIDPNATLQISDGTTLITGHTTCNNGIIHMIGGRIIPQGGLSGDCNIIWEPGTYTNIADFNLDGTVNFIDFAYLANAWLWEASWY